MRSSNKSRSRSKNNNRSRGVGNVVNRVFDSAGPEGKVRGTPQQIIEKYQTLARDAQLSGDRVAAENFQQHSEHYTRMLNDAQREQAERQAADNRNRQQTQGEDQSAQAQQPQPDVAETDQQPDVQARQSEEKPARANGGAHKADDSSTEVLGSEPDSGLVETPESSKADGNGGAKPRATRTRSRKPKKDAASEAELPLERPADTPVQ
ncbi:DUF4167 domain-containing protein [Halovulum sp. GXIMD14794]